MKTLKVRIHLFDKRYHSSLVKSQVLTVKTPSLYNFEHIKRAIEPLVEWPFPSGWKDCFDWVYDVVEVK